MILIQFLLILLVNSSENFSLGLDSCLASSNCAATEYCERDLPNPLGVCKPGYPAGRACIRDTLCASKKCSFFVCAQRDRVRDGLCDKKFGNSDCPRDQYCYMKDDEYRCVNRKFLGFAERIRSILAIDVIYSHASRVMNHAKFNIKF